MSDLSALRSRMVSAWRSRVPLTFRLRGGRVVAGRIQLIPWSDRACVCGDDGTLETVYLEQVVALLRPGGRVFWPRASRREEREVRR